MPDYPRVLVPGASLFLTVDFLLRRNNDLLILHVDVLRDAMAALTAALFL
ncbi:hypothetical protein N1078_16770 [Pseudomonas sp. MIL19]|nr:hypothetical protein [Pseudomonas sp. MIL19]MDD2162222.1 hypothetical protein [Pseudomonas sp. MIL19]